MDDLTDLSLLLRLDIVRPVVDKLIPSCIEVCVFILSLPNTSQHSNSLYHCRSIGKTSHDFLLKVVVTLVSPIPAMTVMTSHSDLFSSSNLRLHPAKVVREKIQFNHTAHSSVFLPSYLGTAVNIASYFCCCVVAAKASEASACHCWTVTMV